jgi:hypothetical protein
MPLLVSLALSGLDRDAIKVAGGLCVACLTTLAFAVSSLTSFAGVAAPGQAVVGAHASEIPSDQLAVMQQAGVSCGLPWQILAAVAKTESDFGGFTSPLRRLHTRDDVLSKGLDAATAGTLQEESQQVLDRRLRRRSRATRG